MASTILNDAVSVLRSEACTKTKTAALRFLKNEAIGHNEQKIALVSLGIADVLTAIIRKFTNTRVKHGTSQDYAVGNGESRDEDEACFQAIVLVDVLLNGKCKMHLHSGRFLTRFRRQRRLCDAFPPWFDRSRARGESLNPRIAP